MSESLHQEQATNNPMKNGAPRFLAICAIVKNEAPYIWEWLSYHHALGIEGFIIYDNRSTDDTRMIISEWSERFCPVYLIDWPGAAGQIAAYEHAIANFRTFATWCAFIDVDEFLAPQGTLSLPAILRHVDDRCDALYVHWLMFGSSGLKDRRPGLVTETFRRRARADFAPNRVGKTIVRMAHARAVAGVHWIVPDGATINDAGADIRPGLEHAPAAASHRYIALNHYFTKSLSEWLARRARGRATLHPSDAQFIRGIDEFHAHDANDVTDTIAAKLMGKARAAGYYGDQPRDGEPAPDAVWHRRSVGA